MKRRCFRRIDVEDSEEEAVIMQTSPSTPAAGCAAMNTDSPLSQATTAHFGTPRPTRCAAWSSPGFSSPSSGRSAGGSSPEGPEIAETAGHGSDNTANRSDIDLIMILI